MAANIAHQNLDHAIIMIDDIKPGPTSGVYLISECKVLKTKDKQRPYTLLRLADKSGEIKAFVWDSQLRHLRAGKFVKVSGQAKEHNGEMVLRLNQASITPVKEPENLDDYIYSLDSLTLNTLWEELRGIINGVKSSYFSALLKTLLDKHDEISDEFTLKNAPLTEERYGAYAGALLEHIVYSCRIVKAVQQNYCDRNTPIDPDLLLSIVIFHDLGRLKAFENIMSVRKSQEGKLYPTHVLSLEVLQEIISHTKSYGGARGNHLLAAKLREGIIAASSNEKPKTIESLIAQKAQSLDALIGIYSRAINFARHDEEFVSLQSEDGELFNG